MNTAADSSPDTSEWIRLVFDIGGAELTFVESFLNAHGALSITFKDAADQPLLEPAPGETPLWDDVRVEALFGADTDPSPLRAALIDALPELGETGVAVERFKDQAWERAWMDRFGPMAFGERIWIYPRHIEPPEDDGIHVRLDPGLAFGTGTHPTTSLCLQWLDRHTDALAGKTVIDYGCGSGLLAVAAAMAGADAVFATDIDRQALTATTANAGLNGVADRIRIVDSDNLSALGRADVVLANILSKVLIDLAGELSGLVKPGGRLVLSGILEEQAYEVRAAYTPWFDVADLVQEDDWVLLEGVRKVVGPRPSAQPTPFEY